MKGGIRKKNIHKVSSKANEDIFSDKAHNKSNIVKYALLLLPTFCLRQGESNKCWRNPRSSHMLDSNNNNMNFIIWNYRGSQSADLRRNFRSLLDSNMHSMIVLLETHCQTHKKLKEGFNFNGLIELAAIGQAGVYGFQMFLTLNPWQLLHRRYIVISRCALFLLNFYSLPYMLVLR